MMDRKQSDELVREERCSSAVYAAWAAPVLTVGAQYGKELLQAKLAEKKADPPVEIVRAPGTGKPEK
jgi:hypothetical protein